MTAPKLSVHQSGHGGRGYKRIFDAEPTVTPSVTTILKSLDMGGVVQWAVDQTAAYAVMTADRLLEVSEEQGFQRLRYYSKRMTTEKFDDPLVDLNNYHTGVLHDAAEMGTLIHAWIEADLNGDDWLKPELTRIEHEQMVLAYEDWKRWNDVEVYATESTLFGDGYAGTADFFAKINGVATLGDTKTSRGLWNSHRAQLAALGACDTMALEVTKDHPGAVYYRIQPKVAEENGVGVDSWWTPVELPPVQQYAFLHVRPDDINSRGEFVPAYCEFVTVSQEVIDAAWKLFQGAKMASYAEKELKDLEKVENTEWKEQ